MLQNQVVLITGGAGLLGKVYTRAVAEQGGIAVIADVSEETAISTCRQIEESVAGARIGFVRMDITSKDSINTAIGQVHEQYGRIDALVNNAYPRNQRYGRSFFEVEYDDFCENLNLHLGGYFLTAQQFARYFIGQGRGNIVNMSSIYGVVAPKFEIYDGTAMTMPVEYAAIKSAVVHLTRYMAKYFKGKNIRVNAISPGGILDGQPESFLDGYNGLCLNKGMLDRQDLAGTLIYLLSDMSLFVNGQNIVVDDGFSI